MNDKEGKKQSIQGCRNEYMAGEVNKGRVTL